MLDIETIRPLLAYTDWSNQRICDAAAPLLAGRAATSPAQASHDLKLDDTKRDIASSSTTIPT